LGIRAFKLNLAGGHGQAIESRHPQPSRTPQPTDCSHVRRQGQARRFDLHSLIKKAGMRSRLQGDELFGIPGIPGPPLAFVRVTLLIIAMAKIGIY